MNLPCSLTVKTTTQKEVDDFIANELCQKFLPDTEICEQDPRSASIEPFNLLDARFIKNHLDHPSGENIYYFLKEKHPKYARLGIHQFLYLWRDYEQNGEQSTISKLNQNRYICSMNFFGTILESASVGKGVISLFRRDYWSWDIFWFDHNWNGCFPSIVLFHQSAVN